MRYFAGLICIFVCMLVSTSTAINEKKSSNGRTRNEHSQQHIFLETKGYIKFQRMKASHKMKKGSLKAHLKDKAIDLGVGVVKKVVPKSILPKRPDRVPMPAIPEEKDRIPLPKLPSYEPVPTVKIGQTVAQIEACVGCVFVWEKTNSELDQSAGYEAVKDAFERTCAAMTPVFYDACDSMFENEDQLIQDYLANQAYTDMCENVGICMSKSLPSGLPK
jgi:hypothetical protein